MKGSLLEDPDGMIIGSHAQLAKKRVVLWNLALIRIMSLIGRGALPVAAYNT